MMYSINSYYSVLLMVATVINVAPSLMASEESSNYSAHSLLQTKAGSTWGIQFEDQDVDDSNDMFSMECVSTTTTSTTTEDPECASPIPEMEIDDGLILEDRQKRHNFKSRFSRVPAVFPSLISKPEDGQLKVVKLLKVDEEGFDYVGKAGYCDTWTTDRPTFGYVAISYGCYVNDSGFRVLVRRMDVRSKDCTTVDECRQRVDHSKSMGGAPQLIGAAQSYRSSQVLGDPSTYLHNSRLPVELSVEASGAGDVHSHFLIIPHYENSIIHQEASDNFVIDLAVMVIQTNNGNHNSKPFSTAAGINFQFNRDNLFSGQGEDIREVNMRTQLQDNEHAIFFGPSRKVQNSSQPFSMVDCGSDSQKIRVIYFGNRCYDCNDDGVCNTDELERSKERTNLYVFTFFK